MTDMPASETPAKAPGDALGIAVLVLGAAIIAFAGILVRLSETGPAAAGFWRLLFALPMLMVLDAALRQGPARAPGLNMALLAGVMFAGDLVFWHYGIMGTSVANATVLSNLSPIVIVVISWIFLNQRPRPVFVAGMVIAIAGAVTMAAAGHRTGGVESLSGDLFSAGTAIWYGLYFLCVTAARRTMAASRVMLISALAGAPLMLGVALMLGEDILPATLAGWAACAGLGLIHVTGQGAIAWSLGRVGPALASVVVLVQPVIAAIAGAILFLEIPGVIQVIGAAVALAGVVIARLASAPITPPSTKT
jgi:drug/metabolite transporter (DMT)-like permease